MLSMRGRDSGGVAQLLQSKQPTLGDLGTTRISKESELFAMGPVQFIGDPTESPKIRLLNYDFGNILSIFPRKKQQNTEFTKFSLVRTPEIY